MHILTIKNTLSDLYQCLKKSANEHRRSLNYESKDLAEHWVNPQGIRNPIAICIIAILIAGSGLLVYHAGGTEFVYTHLIYVPILLERMKGVAKSYGISPADRAYITSFLLYDLDPFACSSVYFPGSFTKKSNLMLLRRLHQQKFEFITIKKRGIECL